MFLQDSQGKERLKDQPLVNITRVKAANNRDAKESKKCYTELYVWGCDSFGQLGLGHKYVKDTENKILKVPKSCSFSIQIKEVACGEDFAFLLTHKGLLYGMGSNQFGKLGVYSQENTNIGEAGHFGKLLNAEHNFEQNSSLAEEVPFVATPKLLKCLSRHKIEKISCGLNHAVAVTKDHGFVYSWGCGSHGQLGRPHNTVLNFNPPQVVDFFIKYHMKVTDVAAGGKHTLFMTKTNQIFSCGMNNFGQLGLGDDMDQDKIVEPQEITHLDDYTVQIACGLVHTQVLQANGKVLSFGDNQFGQLGLGLEKNILCTSKPTEIRTLHNIKKIACNHHSAAIGQHGELYFWGTGVFGTFYEPRIVIESEIVDVSIGGSFGVAKDKDGLLWSWGQNSQGELGLNDVQSREYPHPIIALKRKEVKKIICGGSFAIACGVDKRSELSVESPKRRKRSPFHDQSQLHQLLQQKQNLQHIDSNQDLMLSDRFNPQNVRMFSQIESSIDNTVEENKVNFDYNRSSLYQRDQPNVVFMNTEGNVESFTNLHSLKNETIDPLSGIYIKEQQTSRVNSSVKRKRKSSSLSRSASREQNQNYMKSTYSSNSKHNLSVNQAKSSQKQTKISTSPIMYTRSKSPVLIKAAKGVVQAPKMKSTTSRSQSKDKSQKRSFPLAKAPVPLPQCGKKTSGVIPIRRNKQQTSYPRMSDSLTRNQTSQRQISSEDKNFNSKRSSIKKEGPSQVTLKSPKGQIEQGVESTQSMYDLHEQDMLKVGISPPIATQQLFDQLRDKDSEMADLRKQIANLQNANRDLLMQMSSKQTEINFVKNKTNYTDKVVGELNDEMQKVHDLEHLLRKKEHNLEILKAQIHDASIIIQDKESHIERIVMELSQVNEQNEQLKSSMCELQEALEAERSKGIKLKEQKTVLSNRFEGINQELNTLRKFAIDIQQKKTRQSKTEIHSCKGVTSFENSQQKEKEFQEIKSDQNKEKQQFQGVLSNETNNNNMKNNQNQIISVIENDFPSGQKHDSRRTNEYLSDGPRYQSLEIITEENRNQGSNSILEKMQSSGAAITIRDVEGQKSQDEQETTFKTQPRADEYIQTRYDEKRTYTQEEVEKLLQAVRSEQMMYQSSHLQSYQSMLNPVVQNNFMSNFDQVSNRQSVPASSQNCIISNFDDFALNKEQKKGDKTLNKDRTVSINKKKVLTKQRKSGKKSIESKQNLRRSSKSIETFSRSRSCSRGKYCSNASKENQNTKSQTFKPKSAVSEALSQIKETQKSLKNSASQSKKSISRIRRSLEKQKTKDGQIKPQKLIYPQISRVSSGLNNQSSHKQINLYVQQPYDYEQQQVDSPNALQNSSYCNPMLTISQNENSRVCRNLSNSASVKAAAQRKFLQFQKEQLQDVRRNLEFCMATCENDDMSHVQNFTAQSMIGNQNTCSLQNENQSTVGDSKSPFKPVEQISKQITDLAKEEGLDLNRRPDLMLALSRSSQLNPLRENSYILNTQQISPNQSLTQTMGVTGHFKPQTHQSPFSGNESMLLQNHRQQVMTHMSGGRSQSFNNLSGFTQPFAPYQPPSNESMANQKCQQFVSKSVSAINMRRKQITLDTFKSKLSRLERNKDALEQKMKAFDDKIKNHQEESARKKQSKASL